MIIRVIETKYKCDRCGHEWKGRGSDDKPPLTCPYGKCHSADWNISKRILDLTNVTDGFADESDIKKFEETYDVSINNVLRNNK